MSLLGSANLIDPGLRPNRSSNTASRHRQEAIGVTTRCTPRKSQPTSYPPLGSEKQPSLEGLLNGTSDMASRHRHWEKGASWRAQGLAGENGDRSSGAVHFSQVVGGTHRGPPGDRVSLRTGERVTGYVLGGGLSGQEISRPPCSSRSKSSARRRKEGRHSDLPLFVYLAMPCH